MYTNLYSFKNFINNYQNYRNYDNCFLTVFKNINSKNIPIKGISKKSIFRNLEVLISKM